jgi:hypothetical protein
LLTENRAWGIIGVVPAIRAPVREMMVAVLSEIAEVPSHGDVRAIRGREEGTLQQVVELVLSAAEDTTGWI